MGRQLLEGLREAGSGQGRSQAEGRWGLLWGVPTAALVGAVPAPCSTLFPPCLPWSHYGSWRCWFWGSSCPTRAPDRVGVPKHPSGTDGAVFGVRAAKLGSDWDALGTGSQGKGAGPSVLPMSNAGAVGHSLEIGKGNLGEKTFFFLHLAPVLTAGDSGLRWDPPGLEMLHSRPFSAPAPVPNTPSAPPSSPPSLSCLFLPSSLSVR